MDMPTFVMPTDPLESEKIVRGLIEQLPPEAQKKLWRFLYWKLHDEQPDLLAEGEWEIQMQCAAQYIWTETETS